MGVDMFDRMSEDAVRGYNNAPDSLQMSVNGAVTLVEYGLAGPFSLIVQVPYDLYSGSHFITLPTSPAGWIGYGLSGTAE
jgi:hypothetical protein